MRADHLSIAYQTSAIRPNVPGNWPEAGNSIAYRLANLRTSRVLAMVLAVGLFYLC
jgi:hypothetical protein